MFQDLVILAQNDAAPAPGAGNPLIQLLPFLPVLVFFYFFLIRPQQKQERKRREMIEAVKKSDRVLTNGGIIGTVTSVDPKGDKVVLRVDDDKGVKLTFSKRYIVAVLNSDKDADGEQAPLEPAREVRA